MMLQTSIHVYVIYIYVIYTDVLASDIYHVIPRICNFNLAIIIIYRYPCGSENTRCEKPIRLPRGMQQGVSRLGIQYSMYSYRSRPSN